MRKNIICLLCGVLLLAAASTLQAGGFTYTINGGTVTITGYTNTNDFPEEISFIPSVIEGKPVTSIGNSAFYSSMFPVVSLPSNLVIPDSVTNIGYRAFGGNWGTPTSVTIGDGVVSIGDYAFSGCSELTNVTMGTHVKSIGAFAFYGCGKLEGVTMGTSVVSIGASAFFECWGLPVIKIPDSVVSIGDSAFKSCMSLTNVTIGTNVTSIGNFAFYESFLTDVMIPDSVVSIGNSAFDMCRLTNVIIGAHVTSIGASAFRWGWMEEIKIPDSVTSIGVGAFSGCGILTNVVVGTNVASIGASAFSECTSLSFIMIPDKVSSIGSYAFNYCTGLINIFIGSGVTNIGDFTFTECNYLAGVYFKGKAPAYGSNIFVAAEQAIVYRLPESTGWPTVPSVWGGRPTALWTPVSSYLLTVSGGTGGGSYTNLQRVSIAANDPVAGQIFDRWAGATQYVASVTSSPTIVTMPGQDITLTAMYAVLGNLTIQTNGVGTVTREPTTQLKVGQAYTLTATPGEGFGFASWTGDLTGTNEVANLIMMSNMTVTANFIDIQNPTVTITLPVANSKVSNAVYIVRGTATDNKTLANVLVKVNTGDYMPAVTTNGWKNWGVSMELAAGPNTIRAYSVDTAGNCSPTSSVPCTYVVPGILTVTTNGAGIVTRDPAGDPEVGQIYTLTATPGSGSVFSNWTGDFTSTNKVLIFKMTTNKTVVANFIFLGYYNLTITDGSGTGSYTNGAQVPIMAAAPVFGKTFDRWTGATQYVASVTASNTTVTMPPEDITLTATYRDLANALTVTGGSGSGSYTNGEQVMITAGTPAAGQMFDRWIGSTQYVASVTSASTTVTMPDQAIALTATYKNIYVLTVNGGDGDGLYANGAKVTISATPVAGQAFLKWLGATQYVAGVTSSIAIVTMPASAITLTASNVVDTTKPTVAITLPTVALKISATNGLFTVRGTAADNKTLANVLVKLNNGDYVPAVTTNGWKNWYLPVTLMPGTNTIRAYSVDSAFNNSTTSQVTCTYVVLGNLTIQTNGVGTVTRAPTGALEVGKTYTLTAAAGAGSVFSNWTGAVSNPTNKVTAFTMTSNMTIRANFTDNAKPTVAITAPTALQKVYGTTGDFVVRGTASDNFVLSNVMVQVGSGSWTSAGTTNSLKNWSANVILSTGTNIVRAYSLDMMGNSSVIVTTKCVYAETGSLTITTNGPGKVTVAPTGPLLLGKTYTLTAAANAGGVFSNWLGAVSNPTNKVTAIVMTSNMTIGANFTDTAKPTVTITSPTTALRVSNSVCMVKGTATDNGALTGVFCRVNSGVWTNAVTTNSWKNWSVPVTLTAGSNLVQAYSTDSAGNISATSSVSCTYVVMTPINLEIVGLGKVAGVTNGQLLEIGKTITLTATPATYYLLTDWQVQVNGSTVLSTNRVVPFVMQSNLTLMATFTPGPGLAEQAIRAFYAEMKRLVETHDKAGFFALFSPDYIHLGDTLSVVTNDLDEIFSTIKTFNFNITSITVTGNYAKVYGSVTASFNNGTPSQTWSEPDMIGNSDGFGWLKKTSEGWRVIGDQKRASVGVKTKHDTTPGSNSYYFVMWTDSSVQITNVSVSGPGVGTINLDDTGESGAYAGLAYSGDFTSLTKPPVGSVYTFVVEFADGSQETYQDTIKSWVMTAPVVTTKPTASSDVIRWSSASIPNAANYVVWVSGGGSLWISEELPLNQLSIVYDGRPLARGVTYTIYVEGKNKTSDCAYLPTTFTIPAATLSAVEDISNDAQSTADQAPTSQAEITVDGSTADWTDVPRSAFSYSSVTQEVAVALDGNNIALLLNGCPFSTSDTALVYFKLRMTYGAGDNRHTVDLWTSGSVLYGMVDGRAITSLEAVLLNGVLEVKIPVEQAPSQVTIEEVGCGVDVGNGKMGELFRFTQP